MYTHRCTLSDFSGWLYRMFCGFFMHIHTHVMITPVKMPSQYSINIVFRLCKTLHMYVCVILFILYQCYPDSLFHFFSLKSLLRFSQDSMQRHIDTYYWFTLSIVHKCNQRHYILIWWYCIYLLMVLFFYKVCFIGVSIRSITCIPKYYSWSRVRFISYRRTTWHSGNHPSIYLQGTVLHTILHLLTIYNM